MNQREEGYLQALNDMQDAVRQLISDPSASPEGKVEMFGVVSHLDDLIKIKVLRSRTSTTTSSWHQTSAAPPTKGFEPT